MTLHIFTLNWNGGDKIINNINPLLHNFTKFNMDHHWYIRDNGSTDGSIDKIKSNRYFDDTNTTIYDIGHNRDNFAQGMNFLYNENKFNNDDLILLLNNDVQFKHDQSLMHMYNLMNKVDAGVVGARLLYPNTNKLQHAGVIFSEKYNKMPYHYRHKEESDINAEKNRFFQAVTAAVMLTKVSTFEKLNGLDPYLNWAFEDIDYCLRAGQIGEKIAYCGETIIYHEESASLKKNPVNKLFMQQNVLHFKKKWSDKYKIDHDLYLKDPNYNIIT